MQPQSLAAHSAIKYTMGYDERWRLDLGFSQEPTSETWATFTVYVWKKYIWKVHSWASEQTDEAVSSLPPPGPAYLSSVASVERWTSVLWRGREEREALGLRGVADSLQRPVCPSSDRVEPKDKKNSRRKKSIKNNNRSVLLSDSNMSGVKNPHDDSTSLVPLSLFLIQHWWAQLNLLLFLCAFLGLHPLGWFVIKLVVVLGSVAGQQRGNKANGCGDVTRPFCGFLGFLSWTAETLSQMIKKYN